MRLGNAHLKKNKMKNYIITYYTTCGILSIKKIKCFSEDLEYIFLNSEILNIKEL